MRVPLTAAVEHALATAFTGADLPAARAELAAVDLPLIANNGERVHLALVQLAGGNLAALRRHLAVARVDWRDVLVAAGRG